MLKAKKAFVFVLVMALAALGFSAIAQAANVATQTVTYKVDAINEIEVTGDTVSLTVSTATAGEQPDVATDESTSYAITTNGTNMKITGAIDSAMPDHVTLKVNLVAPSVGATAGDVDISNATATALDLVTGISQVAESDLGITYELIATVKAGVKASDTRTVTFTLTEEGGGGEE